jgi:hypothetical protein
MARLTSDNEDVISWRQSNSNKYFRISKVNGLYRLETAAGSHLKPDQWHWIMCKPEGIEVFDALLHGVALMHNRQIKQRRGVDRFVGKINALYINADYETRKKIEAEFPKFKQELEAA